jgi:hypothetical protein
MRFEIYIQLLGEVMQCPADEESGGEDENDEVRGLLFFENFLLLFKCSDLGNNDKENEKTTADHLSSVDQSLQGDTITEAALGS